MQTPKELANKPKTSKILRVSFTKNHTIEAENGGTKKNQLPKSIFLNYD